MPANYGDRNVCIIGLGYVGLTLAVAMAEAGFVVHGIEHNSDIVDAVGRGVAHFKEVGLDPRLAAQIASGRLKVGTEWPEKGECQVFIVTVGTPLDGFRRTNLTAITRVCERLAEVIGEGALVILRSTVRVGVSREIVVPILDTTGIPYDLAFCPERTLEGRALIELRTLPQIIGGSDDAAAMRAANLFNFLTPTAIRVRDLETAEMIKLINNTQRDLMFAFANEVADMCDAVGVSAVEVIRAGNMGYERSSMPFPGPVGGPCLEKDPYILSEGVVRREGNPRLAMLGREINEEIPVRAVRALADALGDKQPERIGLVGLAFKGRPETSDLRGTLAIPLIAELKRHFPAAEIIGYDPAVEKEEVAALGITAADNVEAAFQQVDGLIFQNNNQKYAFLDMGKLSALMAPGGIIYDLWNQFDPEVLPLREDVVYFGLGTRVQLRAHRQQRNW
jgi:nucleotide sugar dehydrogenase